MNQQKVMYAQKAQTLATEAARLLSEMAEMVAVWDDRLYGPGAANEITALDLAVSSDPLNPSNSYVVATPNDLYAFVIAASQMGKFVESDGAAVAGPYSSTFNKLRRDM